MKSLEGRIDLEVGETSEGIQEGWSTPALIGASGVLWLAAAATLFVPGHLQEKRDREEILAVMQDLRAELTSSLDESGREVLESSIACGNSDKESRSETGNRARAVVRRNLVARGKVPKGQPEVIVGFYNKEVSERVNGVTVTCALAAYPGDEWGVTKFYF